jgi:hypothetical protein
MATSTLVQFLESSDNGGTINTSNRRQIETFIAKEAIAAGDAVAFDVLATDDSDTTLGVYKADANSSPVRVPIGVALALAASGDQVQVCLAGVCDALTSDAAGAGITAGSPLSITNTAGQLDLQTAGSIMPASAILAETVAAAAGAAIRRVIMIKTF